MNHVLEPAAQAFAENPEGAWLVLEGPPGVGKTHLAVAIAGVRLDKGSQVFFAFVPTLLDHLRATFRPDLPSFDRAVELR